MSLGHHLWAYAYMRMLYYKNPTLYYSTLLAEPVQLLPVVYTPTVGEACQKFGLMPQYRRGCYVSIADRGRVREVRSRTSLEAVVVQLQCFSGQRYSSDRACLVAVLV